MFLAKCMALISGTKAQADRASEAHLEGPPPSMLLIVLAWTCLCVAAGFMAGCWCSRRPARGEGAAKQEEEADGPPEKPPRELPPGRRQKLEKV